VDSSACIGFRARLLFGHNWTFERSAFGKFRERSEKLSETDFRRRFGVYGVADACSVFFNGRLRFVPCAVDRAYNPFCLQSDYEDSQNVFLGRGDKLRCPRLSQYADFQDISEI